MSPSASPRAAVATKQPVELADVVRRFGGPLKSRLSAEQYRALWAIAHCRTAAMGGHVERCQQCSLTRYQYHSCRNRHCPKCQAQASAEWRQARQRDLLPVPYFHHVFTLPHELNDLILASQRNRWALLTLLFHSAAATLLEFGHNNLGGQLGITLVLHTWDQQLRPHFHVHALVPSGALATGGGRWIAGGRKFLFPVRALSKVFRAKYLDEIARLLEEGELDLPSSDEVLRDETTCRRWLRRLRKKSWVVYAQPPFAGPRKLLDYLSRYVHRTAISNHRLIACTDDNVSFTYRNRAAGDRRQTATLPGETFLKRFLLHVLPNGFMRVRHYGFLANCVKQQNLARCRELLAVRPVSDEPIDRQTAQEWFQELTGIDLTTCPDCGGRLIRSELPPRDQPRSCSIVRSPIRRSRSPPNQDTS